jgi:hypothetical protein
LTAALQALDAVLALTLLQPASTGASLSMMVTVKLQLGPAADVQVTVVTPFEKLLPEAGLQVTIPHCPVVVGSAKVSTCAQVPGTTLSEMGEGQVTVQGVTVTVNEQLFVLALASVAVQVTVVVPTAKQVPDAGAQLTVGFGQLSLAVGVV